MNVSIQSPEMQFAFGNTGTSGQYASLSGVGSTITTPGARTVGGVELSSSRLTSKKGVTTCEIRTREALFDLSSAKDGAVVSNSVGGSAGAGFAQCKLTVTLPNTAGIVATANDFGTDGVPKTQAAANAAAIARGLQILANLVLNQATGVLAANGPKKLIDYAMLGESLQTNPISRGLMGLEPLSDLDFAIKVSAT